MAGDRVKVAGERLAYTVQAAAAQFAVCTKPFNPKRTVLYTIIDFERGIRGRDNMVFGRGYVTREQCEANLAALVAGEMEVSHRHHVPLEIERVVTP